MFARTPSAHPRIKGQSLHRPFSGRNICAKDPLHRPFIVDKCPFKGHFILECFLKKIRRKQTIFFISFARSWSKRPFIFAYNASDLFVLLYRLWINFYSINDYRSKKYTFTRCWYLFFLCSHELEKDFIKKKMESYGETETELKILIKKDAIQSNDESIQLYKGDQKSLQEKIWKSSEKQEGLARMWRSTGGPKGDVASK